MPFKNICEYDNNGIAKINTSNPTNTPRGFQVDTTWKRPFPRRSNVESGWCVCREVKASFMLAL